MATTGGALDEWTAMAARNSATKRSHHPSDSPLDTSDHDSDTENAPSGKSEQGVAPLTDARDIIPNRNFGYSTGPKGIIQDARDARAAHSSTARKPATGPQRNEHIAPYVENLHSGKPARRNSNESDDDDALFAELENDASADKQYEQSRRAELQRSLRLQDVSGAAFETMVAAAPADAMVVGFVYDDHPEIWQRLEFCIRDVARRHDLVCVKMHYDEARFEKSSAPAILAYRAVEEVAHVLNVYEEISVGDVSVDAVEGLFSRYHII